MLNYEVPSVNETPRADSPNENLPEQPEVNDPPPWETQGVREKPIDGEDLQRRAIEEYTDIDDA